MTTMSSCYDYHIELLWLLYLVAMATISSCYDYHV